MTFLRFFQTYAITIKRMFYSWNWQTPFLGFIIMCECRLLGIHPIPCLRHLRAKKCLLSPASQLRGLEKCSEEAKSQASSLWKPVSVKEKLCSLAEVHTLNLSQLWPQKNSVPLLLIIGAIRKENVDGSVQNHLHSREENLNKVISS